METDKMKSTILWSKEFTNGAQIKRFMVASILLLAGFATGIASAAGFTYHKVQAASSAAGSKERNFSYYVPTSYVAGSASRLWVVLHGCRQTDRTMTDLIGIESLAERDKAIILYPFQNNDASANDNDGRNPNCWGYWFDAQIHRDAGEPGDIKRMVDYMKSNFTVDNNRVHVTGISSGGAMTTIMQVAYPDVFASSVMVEGIGYGETSATYTGTTDCQTVITNNLGVVQATSTGISKMRTEMQKSTLRQPPVMVMHNKKDCTVPIKVGLSLIDTFMGLRSADGQGISTTATSSTSGSVDGLPYTWSKYGSNSNGQSLVETILFDATEAQLRNAGVVDMTSDIYDSSSDTVVKEDIKRGHWWSGAAQRGPWIINKGLNTASVAVDFFNAHPMNGAVTNTTTTTTTTVAGTTTTTVSGSVTPGPGTWSANQTWAADAQHGGNLQGYFYWPSTAPAIGGKRALVLVLHGCAQTAVDDVINSSSDGGFNWKPMADQYGAVILAPNATGNAGGYHCWDYYGTSHSRTAGHPGVLLDLINRFTSDPKYAIDPNQVYVAGLSSGGGEVMVLGCLAPDVFAGIGNNAGPALGTTSGQIGAVPSGYTSTTAKNNCMALAGSNSSYFATQVASAAWGSGSYSGATSDGLVAVAYGPLNMEAMRLAYGGTFSSSSLTVSGGGSGTLYTQNGKIRTSEMTVSGMAHAWPSGSGGQNSNYVDATKINYPQYLMSFWNANNPRIGTSGGGGTTTTTTTIAGGTTTTSTTTTTQSQAYDQTQSASITNHYIAGRINVTQYNTLGARYGYNTVITLYHCPSLNGWTDHANCTGI
jgi:poly(3-hydroxybutyrate) depolymerase